MKVLVLTPYLPHQRVGHGGGTAVRDLVRGLARLHEVHVVSLVRPGEESLVGEVESLGVTVAPIPFLDKTVSQAKRASLIQSRMSALFRSLFSGFPHYVEKYWSPSISRQVIAAVESFEPEAVQIEYLQMSLLARDLRKWRAKRGQSGPRLVLNSHELGSLPRQRRARRSVNPLVKAWAMQEAGAWSRLQIAASGWVDTTLCVTPGDRELYAAMGGHNLATVPLGMDIESIGAVWDPRSPDRFLFVGSFAHRPNRLAAEFLVHRLWPTIASRIPGARLVLAGRGSEEFLASSSGIESWRDQRVEALGFVDDLTPHFRESRLFLAPLPEGGGIKIKILEAMARGIPIVTTAVGAEGIAGEKESVFFLAECDDTFADAVLAAYKDPDAGQRAKRARDLIEEKFSWTAIVERLSAIYAGESGTP